MQLFSVILWSLGLAAPALAADVNCKDESRYPEISKAELTGLIKDGKVFVVDVNSDESFAKAKVDTAIHYGDGGKTFVGQLPAEKGKLIVAYCGGPSCTAWKKAAVEACKSGHTNIKHFKGGIKGWTEKS